MTRTNCSRERNKDPAIDPWRDITPGYITITQYQLNLSSFKSSLKSPPLESNLCIFKFLIRQKYPLRAKKFMKFEKINFQGNSKLQGFWGFYFFGYLELRFSKKLQQQKYNKSELPLRVKTFLKIAEIFQKRASAGLLDVISSVNFSYKDFWTV